MRPSFYYDLESMRRSIEAGGHRELIGGRWEEIGELAFRYLLGQGLTPQMRLLDIGCGCLRVGVRLVDFLERGHYFGVDLSEELLAAGYDDELGRLGLQDKLPRENLLCDADFRFERLPTSDAFDVAIAQSLFTHLPFNHIRLCLARLAPVMAPGSKFYATFFHCPDGVDWTRPLHHGRGGVTSHPAEDPYHYRTSDLRAALVGLPWTMTEPADWGHPANQVIVTFERASE